MLLPAAPAALGCLCSGSACHQQQSERTAHGPDRTCPGIEANASCDLRCGFRFADPDLIGQIEDLGQLARYGTIRGVPVQAPAKCLRFRDVPAEHLPQPADGSVPASCGPGAGPAGHVQPLAGAGAGSVPRGDRAHIGAPCDPGHSRRVGRRFGEVSSYRSYSPGGRSAPESRYRIARCRGGGDRGRLRIAGDQVAILYARDGARIVRLGGTTFCERARRKLRVKGSAEVGE